MVPSLALEEVAALSPEEREKLMTELRAAEALIEAGKCVVYDREDQRRRFEDLFRPLLNGMSYRVVISGLAQRDVDSFYEYLRRYSESTARKYVEAFYDAIERTIAVSPHSFSFFTDWARHTRHSFSPFLGVPHFG